VRVIGLLAASRARLACAVVDANYYGAGEA